MSPDEARVRSHSDDHAVVLGDDHLTAFVGGHRIVTPCEEPGDDLGDLAQPRLARQIA